MIEVEQVSAAYSAARLALHRVSFRADRGEVVGLLGGNGAGKTTLLRILAGLLHPSHGRARVAGLDVVREGPSARRALGYLPEEPVLDGEFRVVEFLHLRAALKGLSARQQRQRADEVCQQLGLQSQSRTLIRQLSKGYRQRVALADALLAKPAVLLLDEPTDGLDPTQRQQTLRLIASLAQQHTVLLSTHVLPEAESICQRVLILDRGRLLAAGTPTDLQRAQAGTARLLLRCEGHAPQLIEAVRAVHGVDEVQPLAAMGRPDPACTDDGSSTDFGITLQIDLRDASDRHAADRIARAVLPVGRLLSIASPQRSLDTLFQQLTRPVEQGD